MNKILIATRNQGKANEFKAMFESKGYEVESLLDVEDLPEIEENGQSFAENARLKAEGISKLTGRMVIGDDSGLMVDALDGAPGIYSARYAGEGHDDEANNQKLLSELKGLEGEDRSAHFHTALCVAKPGRESLIVEGQVDGLILEEARGSHGFGYDPLFFHEELGKTFAELSSEEKNAVSHRAQALKELDRVFDQWMEQE